MKQEFKILEIYHDGTNVGFVCYILFLFKIICHTLLLNKINFKM